MNLTLDIGNTRTKIVAFNDTNPLYHNVVSVLKPALLKTIIKKYGIENCMCSAVVDVRKDVLKILTSLPNYFTFSDKIPIRNKYKTPQTLGNDRLANAIGGSFLFPKSNVLIIDIGTCIKYDFVNAREEYLGGSISPGMEMRFSAMHQFTGKLPLVKYQPVKKLIGDSTVTAMQTGVILGMKEEIQGFIAQYQKRFNNLRIIVTGGDSMRITNEFENGIKSSIFAAADLVNIGLNEIIRFNVKGNRKK
jgi:type III pantothenate kinase